MNAEKRLDRSFRSENNEEPRWVGILRGSRSTIAEENLVSSKPFEERYTDKDSLLARARWLYAMRRRRERMFSTTLFGEPAWDILIGVYIRRLQNEAVTVTLACKCSEAATTTALRSIGALEKDGLVMSYSCKTDARRRMLELTDRGFLTFTRFLFDDPDSDAASSFEWKQHL